jgi:tetratricopeptide (TPR) repeat protein
MADTYHPLRQQAFKELARIAEKEEDFEQAQKELEWAVAESPESKPLAKQLKKLKKESIEKRLLKKFADAMQNRDEQELKEFIDEAKVQDMLADKRQDALKMRAGILYQQARDYAQQGSLDKADVIYRQMLTELPADDLARVDAWLGLADIKPEEGFAFLHGAQELLLKANNPKDARLKLIAQRLASLQPVEETEEKTA